MTKNVNNIIDYSLITLGVTFSAQNIESIIGIILMCIQVVWLCSKMILKVKYHIKNKQFDKIDDAIKETIEDIEEVTKNEYSKKI